MEIHTYRLHEGEKIKNKTERVCKLAFFNFPFMVEAIMMEKRIFLTKGLKIA
jgi:hypothetical protein